MKKRFLTLLLVLVLCLLYAFPALASNSPDYVADGAGLLTSSERQLLFDKLKEISNRQQVDIAVVTANQLEGKTAQDYADDYFDCNGYGRGENRDGVLLLVSMQEREWHISTCGYAITAFTDAGIEYIADKFKSELSDGNYAEAFDIYADQCDNFIARAKSGKPYNRSSLPRQPLSFVWIPVSVAAGFVIALITVSVMKGKLKSVRSQTAAGEYVRAGSMKITDSRDFFLYSTVSRTAIPKDNGSGSSTHVSSSGTTHGGGGEASDFEF